MVEQQGFGLEAGEFWTDPFRTDLEVTRRLRRENFAGVRIDAPKFVPIEIRKTIPVLACRFGTYKDVWELRYEDHAIITAVDLDNNLLFADMAWLPEADPMPAEKKAAGPPPEGFSSKMYPIELHQSLGLSLHPSKYMVTVLLRDRISNRLEVTLGRSPGTYHDEEVDKFLAAERAKLTPDGPVPPTGRTLPTYRLQPDSLEVPEEAGIRLAVDRVVPLTKDAKCLLRGAFRLPALPQEITKYKEPRPGAATAIVGITLLLTGADRAAPSLLRLQVPSYDVINPRDPDCMVSGTFALDLLQLPGMPAVPDTYFLYAFSGRLLEGPTPLTLIPASQLPRKAGG